MHKTFTRALERRGIYTGATVSTLENLVVPLPYAFAVYNRKGSGMVRIEVGFGRHGFFIDWGRRDDGD